MIFSILSVQCIPSFNYQKYKSLLSHEKPQFIKRLSHKNEDAFLKEFDQKFRLVQSDNAMTARQVSYVNRDKWTVGPKYNDRSRQEKDQEGSHFIEWMHKLYKSIAIDSSYHVHQLMIQFLSKFEKENCRL